MAAQKAISLRDRRKTEEASGVIPFSAERTRGIQIEQIKESLKGKTFAEMSQDDKDQLLRVTAISLGLIEE